MAQKNAVALASVASASLVGFGLFAFSKSRSLSASGHNGVTLICAVVISSFALLFAILLFTEKDASSLLGHFIVVVFFLALAIHLLTWLPDLKLISWRAPLATYSAIAGTVVSISGVAVGLNLLIT